MDLEKKIIKFIANRLGLTPEEIARDSSLTQDLNASHLEISDLILALEENFHVKIPEEEFAKWEKISDIINYITDHFDEPSTL